MPTIEQDISSQSKKIYNKLKKEHGDEHVFEHLLSEYKDFEKVYAANDRVLEKGLKYC